MLVELKNGETLNGHLISCDTWMNLTLKEVVQTSPEGDKFFRLPEVYVRGNNVRVPRLPRAEEHPHVDSYGRSNTYESRTKSSTWSKISSKASRQVGVEVVASKEAIMLAEGTGDEVEEGAASVEEEEAEVEKIMCDQRSTQYSAHYCLFYKRVAHQEFERYLKSPLAPELAGVQKVSEIRKRVSSTGQ